VWRRAQRDQETLFLAAIIFADTHKISLTERKKDRGDDSPVFLVAVRLTCRGGF